MYSGDKKQGKMPNPPDVGENKRGNIAHVSSFLTLIGVIHFP